MSVTITVEETVTTITASLTAGALSFNVASAVPFVDVAPFFLKVDNEVMQITARTGVAMTVGASGRGFNGTAAVSHLSGAVVSIIRSKVLPADAAASLALWLPTKTVVVNGSTTTYDACAGIIKIVSEFFQKVILPQNPGGAVLTAQNTLTAAQAALTAAQTAAIP